MEAASDRFEVPTGEQSCLGAAAAAAVAGLWKVTDIRALSPRFVENVAHRHSEYQTQLSDSVGHPMLRLLRLAGAWQLVTPTRTLV